MLGNADIVKLAEDLLTERFGGTQSLTQEGVLAGSGSSTVLRCRVAAQPFFQQRTVVVKYSPATGDLLDNAALIREIVSYQFTTSLPEEVRPGPQLLAYSVDNRIVVISDSGTGDTFEELLETADADKRFQLLRSLGHAIGRMHAGTAHREAAFDILNARMLTRYPDTKELSGLRDESLLVAIDSGVELLENSGIAVSPTVRQFAADAKRRLSSGQHRAFTPFDLSPDNILYAGKTHFLDYEWAGFRDATFDVACVIAGFPQFLTGRNISPEEVDGFVRAWVSEVKGMWPNFTNPDRLQARIVTALIGWALASVTYLFYGSMNHMLGHFSETELGGDGGDGAIPTAEAEALATASASPDPDYDLLAGSSIDSILNEGGLARKDLLETFEAIESYTSTGSDPRLPQVREFAAAVVARLSQLSARPVTPPSL